MTNWRTESAGVLDLFGGRQVLHVTFGSALERFGQRLKEMLAQHEEMYHWSHFRLNRPERRVRNV